MPLTSEFNSKKALRQNLYANCFYEILQLMHLVLVFFALRHDDAAKYALLICFTNIIGKFCDAGIGGATPKLLKTIPHQAVSLFSVIVQQAFIIVPTVALTFATLTQFKGYIVFFIIFCACFDGFATLSRYAVYGTLKGREVINTEVVIMSLRVLTLLPFAFFKASMEMIFAHFVFFLLLNSTAIAVLAWQITMRTSRPLNFLYAKPMHLTVLKIRSQVFSTKIWKDLLSVHALTPIFAYIHGIEYTWLFFILTSILSGLHNIIKLGIGQTAAGLFSQLSPSKHASTTSFLNHALSILIGCSLLFGITGYCMFLYFSQISPDIQTVLLYTVCFGLLIFSDLLPLVYEQYFLICDNYSTYQLLRITEYASLAFIAASSMYLFHNIIITTSLMLCCKGIIFWKLREHVHALAKKVIIPSQSTQFSDSSSKQNNATLY